MGAVNTQSFRLSAGKTDNVIASSGSVTSNTARENSFIYRGEENVWGSLWEWIDGCNIQNGSIYVCTNPEDYDSNVVTSPYIKVGYNYMNSTTDAYSGHTSKMGYDNNHPYCNLPYSYSGSSSTYYCDQCSFHSEDTVLSVGGSCYDGSDAGLSC